MVKILFLCHGNICRSPMGEFILRDMAAKAGAAGRFEIDSAAVSREEIGRGIYPPARRELEKGTETTEARLPCLLTVEKTNYHPRIPNLKSWKASRTAEILRYNSQTIPGLDPEQIGDPGSPTKVPRTYPPEAGSKGVMIDEGSLEKSVWKLAGLIREVL